MPTSLMNYENLLNKKLIRFSDAVLKVHCDIFNKRKRSTLTDFVWLNKQFPFVFLTE